MNDLPAIIPTALRSLLLALLVTSVAAWLWRGALAAGGVAAGGAFAAANLQTLGWLGTRLVQGDPAAKGRAAVLLAVKMAVACGLIVAMLVVLQVPPLALLVGVTLGPLALLSASMTRTLAR
jgi:hypothetical protein